MILINLIVQRLFSRRCGILAGRSMLHGRREAERLPGSPGTPSGGWAATLTNSPCPNCNPPWRGWVYRLWHPILGECWQGPRHFWSRQVSLGYVRTHLKKAWCHTRPVGGTVDKYHFPPAEWRVSIALWEWWAGTHFSLLRCSVHWSGRVCPGSRGSRSRWALTGVLVPQEGLGLSPGAWDAPF